ncbi:MAG: tetratricopeptide repeat protein, partial [Calditrichota bacterium]
RYDLAEKYALAALKIREEMLGSNHPNVVSILKDLIEICTAEGREAEARAYEQRAKSALIVAEKNPSAAVQGCQPPPDHSKPVAS